MASLAIAVAIAAAGRHPGGGIVQDDAHEAGLGFAERINAVIDRRCGGDALTHNKDTGAGKFGQLFCIGEQGKRRGIDQDAGEGLLQLSHEIGKDLILQKIRQIAGMLGRIQRKELAVA